MLRPPPPLAAVRDPRVWSCFRHMTGRDDTSHHLDRQLERVVGHQRSADEWHFPNKKHFSPSPSPRNKDLLIFSERQSMRPYSTTISTVERGVLVRLGSGWLGGVASPEFSAALTTALLSCTLMEARATLGWDRRVCLECFLMTRLTVCYFCVWLLPSFGTCGYRDLFIGGDDANLNLIVNANLNLVFSPRPRWFKLLAW